MGSLFPLVLISSLWTTSKGGGALAFISSNDGHNEFHYTAFAFFVMIFVAVVGGKVQYIGYSTHLSSYFILILLNWMFMHKNCSNSFYAFEKSKDITIHIFCSYQH